MKLTFLGGADEVGASSLLLEISGQRLLIDAGIRPSPKARRGLEGDQLPHLEAIPNLDAVLVTHAHTDHSGALELVTGRFPDAPVYATAPTIALVRVLHQDARRIMQARLDEEGDLPLFDDLAVERLMSAFTPAPIKAQLKLGESLAVTFFPAGHIAGAAMLGIESDEGNLLVTGDFSISPQRTVDGARPPAFHPDLLVTESTYGGRLHANRLVQERKLVETIASVTAAGGKVLIPAFALGRAQELLLILGEARREALSGVPVWADGMVRAICQAYASFAEALPLALQERMAAGENKPAYAAGLFFDSLTRPVQTAEQRNALVWQPGPAVIIASSGMLAGGPSQSYARSLASSPQHAILLTGYQDEESPGRRLQELAERSASTHNTDGAVKTSGSLRLGADKVDVQCRLGTYSLSAHADEAQIISLVETLAPEHVALVHGDEAARDSLEKALTARGRVVHLPRSGETLTFQRTRRPGAAQDSAAEARARQAALNRQRRERLAEMGALTGKWLLLQGDPPLPARCLALASDHLWVELAPGLEQSAWPEAVLSILSEAPPDASDLARHRPAAPAPTAMEPNQALAAANTHFPPQARLRKSGYRLDQHCLTLTFDFPDAALSRFAEQIASLQVLTGWAVEIIPEANHNALSGLARELLPVGWQIVKGPAIYRHQKRVGITVAAPTSDQTTPEAWAAISRHFQEQTGYELSVTMTTLAAAPANWPAEVSGGRLEINAALSLIKTSLEGSTLYRASLKEGEIVLSFISPQVGERYRPQIAALAQRTGWPLSLNPNANQGAILEAARTLIQAAGWTVSKGPGVYPEKAEAQVTLAEVPPAEALSQVEAAFTEQTGFRLIVARGNASSTGQTPPVLSPASLEIPIHLIRLSRHLQTISLDPLKLEKAIERARRVGIAPPVKVRRARDSYLLLDGLYRLRAAEALGITKIPAEIE